MVNPCSIYGGNPILCAPMYIHTMNDTILLAVYIILTIGLILVGKLAGKVAYTAYMGIDPTAYTASIDPTTCTYGDAGPSCVKKTAAEIDTAALLRAQEDGRWVGAWIGFLVGGTLSALKAYDIYAKLRKQ
jgi:hypothetical protein